MSKNILILGAAGRDFHNFNVVFRKDAGVRVVGFTATQIPSVGGRTYPAQLAGPLYPEGIKIHPESELGRLIHELGVDLCVFSYSDVSFQTVMTRASEVLAEGASFMLLGPDETMIRSRRPVISVCAVRTGVGKSATTRKLVSVLKSLGASPAVIRHPMPYGNLALQESQRFASHGDLDAHNCTVEEREEYEPHIDAGTVVFAGVDYEKVLRAAEQEAGVILWDGGNNDFPFIRPDVSIVLVDPHRPGHELTYHPGQANVRMADIVVINKVDTAGAEAIETTKNNVLSLNPQATVVLSEMPVSAERPEGISGKRVLVIEDGPTVTHGEMAYGAGVIAARKYGAAEIVDPRPWAVGSIREAYSKYPHMQNLLPALGYTPAQLEELQKTIRAVDCDLVLVATPVDLRKLLGLGERAVRISYEVVEKGEPDLRAALETALRRKNLWPLT
ncbi:MAG: cyclic 2,3-diphosphoglycerate synthase [Bacillota bacterium]|nr:cyclic 2,3-diphosphoglycerate synthase [Bacillota bacterium]